MTPAETLTLVRLVKATFPAQHIDEYTPDAWHEVLGRFPFADCRAALVAAAETSPFCSASDIADRVRKMRAPRLAGLDEIQPPADLDPDNVPAWLAWRRSTIAAVASGEIVPPKALASGRPSQQMLALMAGVGRRVPKEGR